jgi:hypothetical protein
MIMQNFVLALQEFLSFYQDQCNNMLYHANARRSQESIFLKLDIVEREMTVIELSVHMAPLIKQVKMLAAISLHQRFKTTTAPLEQASAYSKMTFIQNFKIDVDAL